VAFVGPGYPTLALRHPGQAHALNDAFASGTVRRIVAPRTGNVTIAADGETWIERKSRLHVSPRFVQLPEPRQASREKQKCAIE